MTNFRDRRRPGSATRHGNQERGRTEPGRYRHRHGGFRARFRARRRFLGIALVALFLVGTLLGARPFLSGEEVAASDNGSGDGSGGGSGKSSQQLVSSQGQPEGKEGGAAEPASAEASAKAASVKTTESKRAGEQPATAGKEKLGEFRTDYNYSDSKDRKYNLRLSSQAVDGTTLAPGEVFSMNDKLVGLDYREAKVFADGGESTALGGGLCQVTSTVYMAAQLAGLEIVERTAHYTTLPYIRPGFDATVWFGGQGIPELDMQFKNNTGSEILVREYVTEDGILVAEIWGQPTGVEVEMRSEKVFEDLQVGIKWATYKTVKQNGEIVYDGLIHEDLYSFPPPPEGNGEGYNEVRVGGW